MVLRVLLVLLLRRKVWRPRLLRLVRLLLLLLVLVLVLLLDRRLSAVSAARLREGPQISRPWDRAAVVVVVVEEGVLMLPRVGG